MKKILIGGALVTGGLVTGFVVGVKFTSKAFEEGINEIRARRNKEVV